MIPSGDIVLVEVHGLRIDEGADGVIQIEKSVTKIQIFTGPF